MKFVLFDIFTTNKKYNYHQVLVLVVSLLSFFSLFGQKDTELTLTKQEDSLYQEQNDSLFIEKAIKLSRDIHRKKHNQDKEHKIANKAVERAVKIADSTLYAKAQDNLGLLYRFHEWYKEAISLHKKAYHTIKNDPGVPSIYKMRYADNVGVAARYVEQYELAVTYYLKALALAEKEDELRNIAIASNGLGNTISHLPGKQENAVKYFKQAMKAENKRGDSLGIAMNLSSISDYYISEKNEKKAFNYLDRLYKINKQLKDTFGLAITDEIYGRAYFELKEDAEKAENHYLKALKGYQKSRKALHVAQALYALGELNEEIKGLDDALGYYKKSMEKAEKSGYIHLLKENAYKISAIKETQDKAVEALEYYKKGKFFEDSIALKEQSIKIAALDNKYQFEKKEDEVKLLEKDNALDAEKIKAQQKQIKTHQISVIALGSGVILIILFGYIQFKNVKDKRRAQHKLTVQEKYLLQAEYERNMAQAEMLVARMQINPHFIFNCLSAINLLIQKKENKKATKYLSIFSRYTRMILEMPKNKMISLSHELDLIQYYFKLEQQRFEEQLNYSITNTSKIDLDAIYLPPLLLQPFVENAIWHGLLPSPKYEKRLVIEVSGTKTKLKIIIDDNGVGRQYKKQKSLEKEGKKKSMGTAITKERIAQFNKSYNCKIHIQIIDKPDRAGTQVVLTLKNLPDKSSNNTFAKL